MGAQHDWSHQSGEQVAEWGRAPVVGEKLTPFVTGPASTR